MYRQKQLGFSPKNNIITVLIPILNQTVISFIRYKLSLQTLSVSLGLGEYCIIIFKAIVYKFNIFKSQLLSYCMPSESWVIQGHA